MSEQLWYYTVEGKQVGPVDFSVLGSLAKQGGLKGDDLVWGPNLESWTPARTVQGLAPASALGASAGPPPPQLGGALLPTAENAMVSRGKAFFQAAAERARKIEGNEEEAAAMPHVKLAGRLLDSLNGLFSEALLDRLDRLCRSVGHLAYIVAVLLMFLVFCVVAVKQDSMQVFFMALVGILPAATVAHYTAVMFLSADARLIHTMPSRLFSLSFPRSVGLMAFVFALYPLSIGFYSLVKNGEWGFFGMSICASAILVYIGGVSLNPSSLNVEIDGSMGAGDEALGILKFVVKMFLRLSPVVFGVGAFAGIAATGYVLVALFRDEFVGLGFPILATETTIDIAFDVVILGFVPFIAHLIFVLCYLALDVLRAVLAVPERLNNLRLAATGDVED